MKRKQPFVNDGKNLREMLKIATANFPGNNAFKIKQDGKIVGISFLQLSKYVNNLGTELSSRGLMGCRIGIIGDNSFPWFNCFLTIVNGGGVAVPFDKGLTAEELKSCIMRSEIKALFYDNKHSRLVSEILADGDIQIETFKITGPDEVLTEMRIEGERKLYSGDNSYMEADIDEEELAVLLFTSGTTSQSKAVMLSHANIMANITDMHNFEHLYEDDVNMAFLPFHHSFGLVGVMVFMSLGACSVFCDGLKYVTRNLEEYSVTVFVAVPLIVENIYKKILKQIKKEGKEKSIEFGFKMASILDAVGIHVRRKIFAPVINKLGGHLRLIICGAAPLSPDAAKGLNQLGIATIQGYGLTETSPVLCAERPEDICAGSVGKPLPRVKIFISGEDENGIGEIVANGPNVMLGYLNQPEETAAVLKDGMFYTGDLGKFDNKGNLWICGRKKNVIVMKNGKNIFPEEIESLIDKLPSVAECMVFAREKHNELVLWVKVVYNTDFAKENNLSEEQLAEKLLTEISKINSTLPKYKHINHLILSDEPMIKTTTQKIKRNQEIEKINSQQEDELWYNVP